jgi:biotin carboxylase
MMRILILSATTGYQLRSFGDAAARLGFDLTFATDRCHRLDDPWQDHAVAVRFHEIEPSVRAVVRAAADRPVDGLIAVGDRPTVLAARVAQALGLRGNPADAAAAAGNKRATRERFARAGLPSPSFVTMRIDDALPPLPALPCVVKPLGLSGSRGVIRADTLDGARAAVARVRALLERKEIRAMRTGLEDAILIERYIPGQEYALEGVLNDGELQVFAIFDKPDPLDGPFFEETIYLTPSALAGSDAGRVADHVSRAAAALGLRHGPVHAECRINPEGVFVLEVAPRPIGGLCSRVLRFGGGGISLEEVLLRHAAGEDVRRFRREAPAAGVMMVPIPRRGLLKRVEGLEEAGAVAGIDDVRITAKTDQLLEPLPEAGSYLGFIFARGEDPARVDAALRESHRRLRFVIDAPIAVAGL